MLNQMFYDYEKAIKNCTRNIKTCPTCYSFHTKSLICFQGHSASSGESGSPDDVEQHNGKTGGEDGEDILAALEKVSGVGSLRSLYSVGSSQPSLTLDARAVRREESSHSISSGLSLGLVCVKDSLGQQCNHSTHRKS